MAHHHSEKVRSGLSNPMYGSAKEKQLFMKKVKELNKQQKQLESQYLTPEAKALWDQMFNSK